MTVTILRFGSAARTATATPNAPSHTSTLTPRSSGTRTVSPADTTGIVLPGGFSYGDYLRAGAMAARSPIMAEVREAAAEGVPVLGVCNGAQIGCESGLTEGAFTTNESARFQCEHVYLRVERNDTPWTAAYDDEGRGHRGSHRPR